MSAAAARHRDPFSDGIETALKVLDEFDGLTVTALDAKNNLSKLRPALKKVDLEMRSVSTDRRMRAIRRSQTMFVGSAGAYIDFEEGVVSMPARTPAMAQSIAQHRGKAWILMRNALEDLRSELETAAAG